ALVGVSALIPPLQQLTGVGDHTGIALDTLTVSMKSAAEGSQDAATQLSQLSGTALASQAVWQKFGTNTLDKPVQGVKDLDTALTELATTDPGAAAQEYQQLGKQWTALGGSADSLARMLPNYTSAVRQTDAAAAAGIPTTTAFAAALRSASA